LRVVKVAVEEQAAGEAVTVRVAAEQEAPVAPTTRLA